MAKTTCCHERGHVMFNLALSMYCVRIVNACSEEVQRGVDPTRYINLRQMAQEASALPPLVRLLPLLLQRQQLLLRQLLQPWLRQLRHLLLR